MDKCKTHPWYKGKYLSRTNCECCDMIYVEKHTEPAPDPKRPWWRRFF